jgi:hypothetical protein
MDRCRIYSFKAKRIIVIIYVTNVRHLPITVAARFKAWTIFARLNAGVVGSNLARGMDLCVCLFCVYVLCVGSGLATSWSPVQGVLLTVYRIKKLKTGRGPKGRRAIETKKHEIFVWNFGCETSRGAAPLGICVCPSVMLCSAGTRLEMSWSLVQEFPLSEVNSQLKTVSGPNLFALDEKKNCATKITIPSHESLLLDP